MSKYCDSTVLEKNWRNWVVSSTTPNLDKYRELGLLWSRPEELVTEDGIPIIKKNKQFRNPYSKHISHCIALGNPLYFESRSGEVCDFSYNTLDITDIYSIDCELSLTSDSPIHNLEDPLIVKDKIIPSLKEQGYFQEKPKTESWQNMLVDITNICNGISLKFNLQNNDEYHDLAYAALDQIINKLIRGKLLYIPGKAPVFNLLTTAIHRCMFSILSKNKNQRNHMKKFLDCAKQGALPQNVRSFKASLAYK